MSFKNNPGLELIKQAFEEFSAKYNSKDVSGNARKAGSEIAKAFADAVKKSGKVEKDALINAIESQLSAKDVEAFVTDLYALLAGPKTSEGLAMLVQSLDVSQLEQGLTNALNGLKDPVKNQQLAQAIKQLAATGGVEQIRAQLKDGLSKTNLPPIVESVLSTNLDTFAGFVSSAKDMSVTEITDRITAFADSIPVAPLTFALYGVMANITPETVSGLVKTATASLPSPQDVAARYEAALQTARNVQPTFKKPSNDDTATPKKAPGKDFKFKGFDNKKK